MSTWWKMRGLLSGIWATVQGRRGAPFGGQARERRTSRRFETLSAITRALRKSASELAVAAHQEPSCIRNNSSFWEFSAAI